MDAFDGNEACLAICDDTIKDLVRHLGKKSVNNLEKRSTPLCEKYTRLRLHLKEVEVRLSNGVKEAESFEWLSQTIEERTRTVEETWSVVKDVKLKDLASARRNLELIKVSKNIL